MNRRETAAPAPRTYISLFSGAGIGCHGFAQRKFECIASSELDPRRLEIQKHNRKCRYPSGYISGDLAEAATKERLREELLFWKRRHGVNRLDALIATPPCQGMSVANHKKGDELARNSLVVESIQLTREFLPRFFIFENVRSFLNVACTDIDGSNRPIRAAIELNLGGAYNILCQTLNFKDYGGKSSRTRTLVIGVSKDLPEITPLDILPDRRKECTLREVIGGLPPLLAMGAIDPRDIYHNFRPYAPRMTAWIERIKEGESAFDNADPKRRPHRVINGEIVFNANKNGDKYTRCCWDRPGACVHTRNDILSSQATIHPEENRVFSVRELMRLMTIPKSFRWSDIPEAKLNRLPPAEKRRFLKRTEFPIRRAIGEAVPTAIFAQVARKIGNFLEQPPVDRKAAQRIVEREGLTNADRLKRFVSENLSRFTYAELSRVVEAANAKKTEHAAYYTRQDICYTVVKDLPPAGRYPSALRILEPAAGTGNFLPLLIEKYRTVPRVDIDIVDIDPNAIAILKLLARKLKAPRNVRINFRAADFLLPRPASESGVRYDIAVGNPPFGKIARGDLLTTYKQNARNSKTNNLFSFFLEKTIRCADTVALIMPKSFLSAPEFNATREFVSRHAIRKIADYGEKAFEGVKIETVSVMVDTRKSAADNEVLIESYIDNKMRLKPQEYICAQDFPYWLIYRDEFFDRISSQMKLGIFTAYRDRQITKKITKPAGRVRVLRARNIADNTIVDIPEYDSYVDECKSLSIAKYMNRATAVLVPNLTYNPRACFLPRDAIVDGSVAVLIPKPGTKVTRNHLSYYNSDEFAEFYRVARNCGSRSLNIDSNSVFFFGLTRSRRDGQHHANAE